MALVQFAIGPNFSHIQLGDSSPVSAALNIVCEIRKKTESADRILQVLNNKHGFNTIADLRRLTDIEWKTLDGIPVICKIFLKYLVRQSSKGSGPGSNNNHTSNNPNTHPHKSTASDPLLASLENDFNNGRPFDLTIYDSSLQHLKNMGFGMMDSLEALCITENKSTELALEFLIQDSNTKKKKRAEQVEKIKAKNLASKHDSNSIPNPSNSPGPDHSQLLLELTTTKSQLDRERTSRLKVESDLKSHIDSIPRLVYKEFLRGLISNDNVLPVLLNQLKFYRESNNVTQAQHISILSELGLTSESLESMKSRAIELEMNRRKGDQALDPDCVICMAKVKSHVLLNCMHVCLCEDCIDQLDKKAPKCPICSARVDAVKRVYI